MPVQQLPLSPAQQLNNITIDALFAEELALFEGLTIDEYPGDKSIVALFEEQAASTPDAIAIVFGHDQVTYEQLNQRANQLARYLQKLGVKPETMVPICVERSITMLVGILGILKSGGAYVPIDPEYPADRIRYMLEDTRAFIALSSSANREKLNGTTPLRVIAVDSDIESIAMEDSANLPAKASATSLAYVIYTSGSTGEPKGVMIEHRSVVSLVKEVDYVTLNNKDVLLVTGSPSFDATTFEYWGMLLNGGRLILGELEDLLDNKRLEANINKHKVNIMWFTTSWFNQLVDFNPEVFAGLKTILAGGEKLSEHHMEKIRKKYPQITLINGYGPTENTTFSLTYTIDKVSNPIPIGKPLNNRTAYILNHNQLSNAGETGEICVGGAGIARGYLNNAALTAEKFVNDPFSTDPGARLYRTGDLGRWLPDGNMEYMGRIDDQVKIRGYRIELGEIESVLNQSGLVNHGVVLAKQDATGNKRLVGYIVPNGAFNKQAILDHLNSKLPAYMVPAIWVELNRLPVTANGKTDRKALPEPALADMTAEYAAPRNETEAQLARIWQELLGLERVGIYDNFLALGGHSLLAIRMIAAVRNELGAVLTFGDLLTYPDLAGLAERINNKETASSIMMPVKATGSKIPLYIICSIGTAFEFIDFVKLLHQEQPVYVLQMPLREKELETFPTTIEGIATLYLSELLEKNPDGPYALTGSCAGGYIAHEMAVRLKEMGKEVNLLAMFDSYAKESEIAPSLNFMSKLKLGVQLQLFLLLNHPKQALQYKINAIKSMLGFKALPKNEELAIFHKMFGVFKHAMDNHLMKTYDGDMLLFYAKESYYFTDLANKIKFKKITIGDAQKKSWESYARSIKVYDVEGEHVTIFDVKHAAAFAKILQKHLDDASAE